jgi:hypothetical protein
MFFSALRKWCGAYKIKIDLENIKEYIGEKTHSFSDCNYTTEEIQKMLDFADRRQRALILFLVSSGVRVGALEGMKKTDLTKIENLYKVRVYPGSKEEYETFISPEASSTLERYWKTVDSEFVFSTFGGKRMTAKYVQKIILLLLQAEGIRKPLADGQIRHKSPLLHSFRKMAFTSFIKAGLREHFSDILLGHSIGLAKNYLRYTEDELLAEYKKAVPLLTFGEEQQLKSQVNQLRQEVLSVEQLQKIVARQAAKISEQAEAIAELGSYVDSMHERYIGSPPK